MQLLLRHTIVPLYLCLKRALLKLTSRASRPIGRLLRPLVLGLTIVGTARPACVGHLHAAHLQLYTPSCPLIYSFTSTLTIHQWIFQELLYAACLHSALDHFSVNWAIAPLDPWKQNQQHASPALIHTFVSTGVMATTSSTCYTPWMLVSTGNHNHNTPGRFVSTSSQLITYLGVF